MTINVSQPEVQNLNFTSVLECVFSSLVSSRDCQKYYSERRDAKLRPSNLPIFTVLHSFLRNRSAP